ncbi:AEC family transporter [Modicisalibacter sp. 'Wilcox']|uniref:AEC family transporter n=1 Tax=Modicisalibacter sp. 'Wilcox' TaxID=2679914 RepID=UPI0013D63B23|nr:AEC family transporter [Modicisalibacter sp. 'Wilcox']
MLGELFAVMAPVFFGASLGFGWVRLGHDYPVEFITRLVFNIGTPTLILASLNGADIDPGSFGRTLLGTLLVITVMGLASLAIARVLGKPWRTVILPTMFPNTGNMGLPVTLYAFGNAGFAYAITVMVSVSLVQFTFGTLLSSRSGRPLRSLARTPVVYAILIATAMLLTGTTLPAWLANTVELISGFSVPLMLITLGVSLGRIRVRNLAAGVHFSLLRIPAAALLAYAVGHLLGLPPLAQSVLVLQMSMPVAVFNYLFAQRARREPEFVAGLVLCSTLLSFVYLPVLLAVMM